MFGYLLAEDLSDFPSIHIRKVRIIAIFGNLVQHCLMQCLMAIEVVLKGLEQFLYGDLLLLKN
jgi:hypothetical protein